MARHTSVKSRNYKKSNWSHENRGVSVNIPSTLTNGLYQGGQLIVPPTTAQGTRTVGNFTVTVPVQSNAASNEVWWALIYVPQGTTANPLFNTGPEENPREGSLYEPNQFVIASGLSDGAAGPIRIRSRIMRKLHSGDFISLLLGYQGTGAPTVAVTALVSYSIKYN